MNSMKDDSGNVINDGSSSVINEAKKQVNKGLRRFSKSLKVILIAFLVLLLLIPISMVDSMIWERQHTQSSAIDEVCEKWSLRQIVTGPYLTLKYSSIYEVDGEKKMRVDNVVLLPDELYIDAVLNTEVLKRSIYKVNVYNSELIIKGSFSAQELEKSGLKLDGLQLDRAAVCLNMSDMRGLSEQVIINMGGVDCVFEPGIAGRGLGNVGIHTAVDLSALRENKTIPYEMKMKLKGSQSIHFVPLGKTTNVNLTADCNTPSFNGMFLPSNREVTKESFEAHWKVLNLNRNYSQVPMGIETKDFPDVMSSSFGVDLKIPVDQYQQSMRSTKYAILIILLTFVVIFFTEILDNTRIHPLQYLLVGLALCLFYSLLLSLSEHIGFRLAYIVASGLTIVLVGTYMFGVIKRKRPAIVMTGLLCVLYLYVYVLIQLETFALFAGSLGLFVALALVMYYSKKIDWFND